MRALGLAQQRRCPPACRLCQQRGAWDRVAWPLKWLVLRAVKLPLLAAIVWGKLRKWHPRRSGFFSFRIDRAWALRLAALCLLVPVIELPLYHLRVRCQGCRAPAARAAAAAAAATTSRVPEAAARRVTCPTWTM